jgi:hypothetical protein
MVKSCLKRVLWGQMLGSKAEANGGWRNVHTQEFPNFYSPNIIGTVRSRCILKGRGNLKELDEDGCYRNRVCVCVCRLVSGAQWRTSLKTVMNFGLHKGNLNGSVQRNYSSTP